MNTRVIPEVTNPSFMPSSIPEGVLELVQHELGHHVVAEHLGFKTGHVTLKLPGKRVECGWPHDASALIFVDEPLSTLDEIEDYLCRRVQVLFAGATAQSLRNGKLNLKIDQRAQIENAAHDMAKAKELVELLVNMRSERLSPCSRVEAINAATSKLWMTQAEIVQAEAKWIERAAIDLAGRALRLAPNEASLSPPRIAALRSPVGDGI